MARRIVVEWTRASLRVAVAEGSPTRSRLRALYSRPLSIAEDLPAVLRPLLKTAGLPGASLIAVVPREQVLTRMVKFPTVHAEELSRMTALYAKAQLPYANEQTVVDFRMVEQGGGFSTVLLVACQRPTIEQYLGLIRASGATPQLVTVSSWGVLGWYRQWARAGASQEPVLVVNVDDTRTDFVLLRHERVLSSRSLAQGAQDWLKATDLLELLEVEVERSQTTIRKELPGTEARSLILTGLGALSEWREPLAQRLGLPVSVVATAAVMKGLPAGAFSPSSLSPVVVGGLSCGEVHRFLNLNPPELRLQLQHRRQVQELTVVALLLIAVLALGAGLLVLETSRQRYLSDQLDRILAQAEPKVKRVRDQARLTQTVRSVLENHRRLALALTGVFQATPETAQLERLTFERSRGEVILKGNAASTQVVLDYVKMLDQAMGVESAVLKYSTRRSTPSGERTDFEIALRQEGRKGSTGAAGDGSKAPPRSRSPKAAEGEDGEGDG